MTGLVGIMALIAVMIFFNALYVAAEFSAVASRRTKVSRLAEDGNRMAGLLLPTLEDSQKLDRYVAACQIGITLSSLVLGAFAQGAIASRLTPLLADLLASTGLAANPQAANALATTVSVAIVLIFITALQVIFGELFPKSVAVQYPENVAMSVYWPMRISLFLFAGLIWIFNGSANVIMRIMGRDDVGSEAHVHSPEEIGFLVTESHEGGLLDDIERQLLRNALRLRDLTARQIMVHRTKMLAAPKTIIPEDLLNLAIEAGYSRIPLYGESVDDIVGFVHVKDVFRLYVEGEKDITTVIRGLPYVPETIPANDLWDQLNSTGQYVAVVFDEFGGTAGLITQEDLIEEIFGELQDEFDDEMAIIARDKDGRIYLRGDLLVSDVNEYLDLSLPTESADTLSGLLFSTLEHPPQEQEEIVIDDIVIRVETIDDLSVDEVSLILPPGDDEYFSEWEIADHD